MELKHPKRYLFWASLCLVLIVILEIFGNAKIVSESQYSFKFNVVYADEKNSNLLHTLAVPYIFIDDKGEIMSEGISNPDNFSVIKMDSLPSSMFMNILGNDRYASMMVGIIPQTLFKGNMTEYETVVPLTPICDVTGDYTTNGSDISVFIDCKNGRLNKPIFCYPKELESSYKTVGTPMNPCVLMGTMWNSNITLKFKGSLSGDQFFLLRDGVCKVRKETASEGCEYIYDDENGKDLGMSDKIIIKRLISPK